MAKINSLGYTSRAASQRYSVEIETKGEAEINFNNDLNKVKS